MELHKEHNAYPLAPEKGRVTKAEVSPYQRVLLEGQGEDRTEKLLLTLKNKSRYVLHHRNLINLKINLKIYQMIRLRPSFNCYLMLEVFLQISQTHPFCSLAFTFIV